MRIIRERLIGMQTSHGKLQLQKPLRGITAIVALFTMHDPLALALLLLKSSPARCVAVRSGNGVIFETRKYLPLYRRDDASRMVKLRVNDANDSESLDFTRRKVFFTL